MRFRFPGPVSIPSESGRFYLDRDGIAYKFRPAVDNPYCLDDYEQKADVHYSVPIQQSIRSLVVPPRVVGFAAEFMRGTYVQERFELPDGLESIGRISVDEHCVFANCDLPEVILPASLREIGTFAFGNCRIGTLKIPATLRSPYARQFKDSYVETLLLPKEWEDKWVDRAFRHEDGFGFMIWPSTGVGHVEYY